ncbi:MAG: hypothetical protein ABI870_05090 [Rhodanobacter sp.]
MMGLLDSAGQAAKGATDAATDNPVGGLMDALDSGLNPKAATGPAGSPHYLAGDPLDSDDNDHTHAAKPTNTDEGDQAPKHVPLNLKKPLQFVHLCYAHDDGSDNFPGESPNHGIAMRDALIREDVLLYSFARGAQRVLEAAKTSKGAAGAMLDAASSLLGGGKSASGDPSSIDPVLSKIRAAGDSVNVEEVAYTDVHAAGTKLAEAWFAFGETCKTSLVPGKGGGMGLPSIPGLSSLAGGAGIPAIIAQVPSWLFKVQDAYQGMFTETHKTYEWEIMKVCHAYSVQAIIARHKPGYDIWFLPSPDDPPASDGPQSAPEKTLQDAQNSLQKLPSFGGADPGKSASEPLGDMQKSIAGARQGARDTAGDITGWLATAETMGAKLPPDAVAAVAAAIAVLAGNPQGTPKVDALGTVLGRGLAQGLGLSGGLPGPLQTYVDIIGDITLTLLPKIYGYVHSRYGEVDPALICAAVHEAIADRVVDLIWALIFGKGSKPGSNDKAAETKKGTDVVDNLGQGQLGAGNAIPDASLLENKAADLVTNFIKGQGHYINFLILFIAEDVTKELQLAWLENLGRNTITMEAYLGRLPQIAALLGRNLVFPVFNLLMQVFGIGDKLAGMVWDPVKEKIGQAGDIAHTVKKTKDDVHQAGDDIADGSKRAENEIGNQSNALQQQASDLANPDSSVSSLSDLQALKDQKEQQARDLGNTAQDAPGKVIDAAKGDPKKSGDDAKAPEGSGPISAARKTAGKGKPLQPGDVDKAGRVTIETESAITDALAAPPPAAPPASSGTGIPGLPF